MRVIINSDDIPEWILNLSIRNMIKITEKLSEMRMGRLDRGGAASVKVRQGNSVSKTGKITPKIFQTLESCLFDHSTGPYDNMCAPQSMYNSFSGEEKVGLKKQAAFSGGDLKDFTSAFVNNSRDFILPVLKPSAVKNPELVKRENELNKVAKQRMKERAKKTAKGGEVEFKVETSKTGYTKKHIIGHFRHLLKTKKIKSYKFEKLKRNSLFKIMDPARHIGMKVLVMGVSVPRDRRPARGSDLRKSMTDCKPEELKTACDKYDQWCNKVNLGHGKCSHGLVLAQEGVRDVYLYDDACKVVKRVTDSPVLIADQIANIFAMYAFDIEV